MLKLLFEKLQIRPTLAPGETADLLGHCLGTSGGIQAIVFQRGTDDHPSLGTANRQDRNVAVSST